MKPYLLVLFMLPLLLFALPAEAGLPTSGPGRGINSSASTGPIFRGNVDMGTVLTAAVPSWLVFTDNGLAGKWQSEAHKSCHKSSRSAKKACTKRKCLKHHHRDPAPAGAIPAPACSLPLVAVINQTEVLGMMSPISPARSETFYRTHMSAPDLELKPRPPRFS